MRLGFCLILLLFCEVTSAASCKYCVGNNDKVVCDSEHILHAMTESYLVGEAAVIANASCQPQIPTDAEMQRWLDEKMKTSALVPSALVNGIKLSNENGFLVGSMVSFLGMKMLNPDKIGCDKALCVLKKVFGEKEALRLLYIKGRYGFNASHLIMDDTQPWTLAEYEIILKALADWPSAVIPFPKVGVHPLVHRTVVDPWNPESDANSEINVFPNWDKHFNHKRRGMLFHEFAHVFAKDGLDLSEEWMSVGGWKVTGEKKNYTNQRIEKVYETSKPEQLVSGYAGKNPREDFAESVVAYRYKPDLLKKKSLPKYEFIKKHVFKEYEYLDLNCPP